VETGTDEGRCDPVIPPQTGERLIGVLIPPTIPRRPPPPQPMTALPARRHPSELGQILLDVARLDPSGRLSTRALVRALG